MLSPISRVPDRDTLQAVADIMSLHARHEGAPDARVKVNENATGLSYHHRYKGVETVIDLPVTLVGDEVQIRLPKEKLACFKRDDLLDRSRPIWNN